MHVSDGVKKIIYLVFIVVMSKAESEEKLKKTKSVAETENLTSQSKLHCHHKNIYKYSTSKLFVSKGCVPIPE